MTSRSQSNRGPLAIGLGFQVSVLDHDLFARFGPTLGSGRAPHHPKTLAHLCVRDLLLCTAGLERGDRWAVVVIDVAPDVAHLDDEIADVC